MKQVKLYDHKAIEKKWQKIWEERKLYQPDLDKAERPFYNLMMWPYSSAEGLHVGNMYAFTGADIYGRLKQMQGYQVFEPIGFDSGGLHSENYAIKIKKHPKKVIRENIRHFREQLHRIGAIYDWAHSADAMDPAYYKWTQWIFTKLFKGGLAYKKEAPITWCSSCKTTVSDEQTERKLKAQSSKLKADREEYITVCERCKTEIERRRMKQWFFKITDYAERLLENIKELNWSEKVLTSQRNWIGKSEGAEIRFKSASRRIRFKNKKIKVFTTRPDTLHGCTFFCLAPEHQFVTKLLNSKFLPRRLASLSRSGQAGEIRNPKKEEISEYVKRSLSKTEQERITEAKEKTGVFTGSYVINPASGKKVPIYVADYVLLDYGKGAVMGVPAHDKRDWQFAKKYNLPILPVIKGKKWQIEEKEWKDEYAGKGKLINSGEWNGWRYPEDMKKIVAWLEKKNLGKKKITYKLRDWCISRQRYWGPPIPMIYCKKCGWQAVAEKDLPVLLPDIDDYLPADLAGSGRAPLAKHPEFYKTTCPECGGKAKRETDVSDTFLDSSWYFLAYPNVGTKAYQGRKNPFDKKRMRKWLPVDQYIGGAEHSVLHLMYSRFITMALHDLGYLNFSEPFPNFYAHGLLIKDGAKMSKSRGNVVNPDEYIEKYGADTLRMYLMFMGPLSAGGDFRDAGMRGMHRFVKKLYNLAMKAIAKKEKSLNSELETELDRLSLKMEEDLARFKYNTAIAKLMEFVNLWTTKIDKSGPKIAVRVAILLAPLAPYLAEEVWHKSQVSISQISISSLKSNWSVHQQSWPKVDKSGLKKEEATVVIQINGKLRDRIQVKIEKAEDKDKIIKMAKGSEKAGKYLKGKKIKKTIFVSKRLVNFVI